ncbi:MAG: type II toxin-antitoxin system RelE/ParE family toxin [Bradyrhizobium sp.]
MKVFKTRTFARLVRNTDISDQALREAVERAMNGLVDAELGNGLVKQRVARQGQGRSGGYRTIIALRAGDRAFFLHCFAKNDRANISDTELRSLREIAAHWLDTSPAQIEAELEAGRLLEVKHGKKKNSEA